MNDDWNNILAEQAVKTLWLKNAGDETRDTLIAANVAALMGIAPKDELEGMMAAQLIAAHNAAMECYRRAMIGEQTFEGRRENLTQANKLSRTYAALLEALNRHRGKGQQKVTVEHVHVHAGGQAVVGSGRTGGWGCTRNARNNPMQSIANAPSPRCGPGPAAGSRASRRRCRTAAAGCTAAGSPGAPKGNNNALKHGRYTADAIAERRHLRALVRELNGFIEEVERSQK